MRRWAAAALVASCSCILVAPPATAQPSPVYSQKADNDVRVAWNGSALVSAISSQRYERHEHPKVTFEQSVGERHHHLRVVLQMRNVTATAVLLRGHFVHELVDRAGRVVAHRIRWVSVRLAPNEAVVVSFRSDPPARAYRVVSRFRRGA